jgi:hypothetical protein
MNTQRPPVVTIAAILLIILSLFVGGLGLANQSGLLGIAPGNPQFSRGGLPGRDQFPGGNNPQGRFPEGGFPQDGNTQDAQPFGGLPNDPNNSGQTPSFTPNRQFGSGVSMLFSLIRPVLIALNILLIGLGILVGIGLFKTRRWAAVLAVILSVLLIVSAIPGFLPIVSVLLLVENLVRIGLALAVIVLLLLPSARKSFARPVEEPI